MNYHLNTPLPGMRADSGRVGSTEDDTHDFLSAAAGLPGGD